MRGISFLKWLRGLLPPLEELAPGLLDTRISALAAEWRVEQPIACDIVRLYAAQRGVSLQDAAEAMRGLRLDEARDQVGTT